MEDKKKLISMAIRAQGALLQLRHCRYLELMRQLTSFAGKLQEVTSESRKMGSALAHGWLEATQICCNRIYRLLGDITYPASRIKPLAEEPNKQIPKVSALVSELRAVEEEFGEVEINLSENTLSVTTEPITLEDVYLGPFTIRLELNTFSDLYQNSPYHIIALDPHPASSGEAVTHPHVHSERLCEGDGSAALKTSLQQGRLVDFFTMVRSILNTYNPESPYVALRDWDGQSCYECGYVVHTESGYYCSFCENSFCDECVTCCASCSETICAGCALKCDICEDPVCPRCTRVRCIECRCICCESCIDEGLCDNCRQERENEDEERANQITETNETRAQSDSETSSAEIRLAS